MQASCAVADLAASEATPTEKDIDELVELEKLSQALQDSDESFQQVLEQALYTVERCLALYDPNTCAISFNGGKDATVLLHIVRLGVLRHCQMAIKQELESKGTSEQSSRVYEDAIIKFRSIPIIYFHHENQFPEIDEFMKQICSRYKLCGNTYTCKYEDGLRHMIEKRSIKSVFMGVRKGDPHSDKMQFFCPSTPGWPPLMRVNPILQWEYPHVWTFLRGCGLDYPSLYDQGYTSLGDVLNTKKNDALRRTASDGTEYYLPAYTLQDGSLERDGRSSPRLAEPEQLNGTSGKMLSVSLLFIGGSRSILSLMKRSAEVTLTRLEEAEMSPTCFNISLASSVNDVQTRLDFFSCSRLPGFVVICGDDEAVLGSICHQLRDGKQGARISATEAELARSKNRESLDEQVDNRCLLDSFRVSDIYITVTSPSKFQDALDSMLARARTRSWTAST